MNIWAILEYTAAVTVIGLLICLIKLVFRDKLDARWHFLIWLVLLVRLVVPGRILQIPVSLSVFQEIPIGKWLEMAQILVEKKGLANFFELLGGIYLWGAILLGIYYLLMWLLLRIQVARASKADPEIRRYVGDIAARYGLKNCWDIRVTRTNTPYICGLFHPVLVIPEGGERPGEPVILHELLHQKYKDVLVNITLHVVRVINWFNPFIWYFTAMVQNDSEALCDQRVLECCGRETASDYGELLISIGEGNGKHSVKIGTSNMASSYRNMKTRIRRIRDFGKVPKKIGLVTLCITLMLAVAGIGTSAENYSEIPQIETEQDLERALLNARCYHARTPQEAVYLFLRACQEHSIVYRMIVMPEEEISRYEEFASQWFRQRDAFDQVELMFGDGSYPDYFPKDMQPASFKIYNLQYGEQTGSATVWARSGQEPEEVQSKWKLSLKKDKGWTVWLEEECQVDQKEYEPEPLLYGSRRLGEELSADSSVYIFVYIFVYGREGLKGDTCERFHGSDFEKWQTCSVISEASGYPEPGWCWEPGDQIGVEAAIYVDGTLMEAGEVWSEKH